MSKPNEFTISQHIQEQLAERGMDYVTAVEAAQWLDRAGILTDRKDRHGAPLRELLREKKIVGQRQEPNARWFIDQVK